MSALRFTTGRTRRRTGRRKKAHKGLGFVAVSDFFTFQVSDEIDGGTSIETLVDGVDYNLPAGTFDEEDGFLIFSNSRLTCRGRTSLGGNQNLVAVTGEFDSQDWLIPTSAFTVQRGSTTSDDTGFTAQGVVWTGPSESPNRFKNIWEERLSPGLASTATTQNFTVTDPTRVMVLVTGQRNSSGSRTPVQDGLWTADAINQVAGSTYNVTVRRGGGATTGGVLSVAVIEWGSYWKVQRIEFSDADPYDPDLTPGTVQRAWSTGTPDEYGLLDITQAGTFPASGLTAGFDAFEDLERTILHHQYRIEALTAQGNDDSWSCVEADVLDLAVTSSHADHTSGGQTKENFLITRRKTSNEEGQKFHVVWALEWQPPAGVTIIHPMKVQHVLRYFDTTGVSPEEQIDASDTTANAWLPGIDKVASLERSTILATGTSSDGVGAGCPRGLMDLRFQSASVIEMVRSESGQEERESGILIEWPTIQIASGGTLAVWEQARAGLSVWQQPVNVSITEQARGGISSVSGTKAGLSIWEQRRAGLNDWQCG